MIRAYGIAFVLYAYNPTAPYKHVADAGTDRLISNSTVRVKPTHYVIETQCTLKPRDTLYTLLRMQPTGALNTDY